MHKGLVHVHVSKCIVASKQTFITDGYNSIAFCLSTQASACTLHETILILS